MNKYRVHYEYPPSDVYPGKKSEHKIDPHKVDIEAESKDDAISKFESIGLALLGYSHYEIHAELVEALDGSVTEETLMNKMEYKILETNNASGLVYTVNAHMRDGWTLHGGLSVYCSHQGKALDRYTQAMVRNPNE